MKSVDILKKIFMGQCIFFAIVFIIFFICHSDKSGITDTKAIRESFNKGWTVKSSEDTKLYDTLPVSVKSKDNKVCLTRKIGKISKEHNAIGFFSFQKNIHIYIDETEVLSFTNTTSIKSKMPGNSWIFYEFEEEDEGHILTIEMEQCYAKGSVTIPMIYSGTISGITNRYMRDKIMALCFSVVGIAVGVVLIMLWLCTDRNIIVSGGLPWLGVFAVIRGTWSYLEANTYSIHSPNLILLVWISYLCLKFTVVPFALFFDITFYESRSKFLKVLMYLSFIDIFLTIPLQIMGIADFADTILPTNVLIFALCIYVMVTGINGIIKEKQGKWVIKEKQMTYRVNIVVVFILVATSLIDLYRFYCSNSPDIARFSRGGYFIYVIAIMTAIMWDYAKLVSIGRQAENIQAEAYMDPMTKLNNRAFFEKYIDSFEKIHLADKAIVMFDLNNLKKFNDIMGHDMGDCYIKICSEVIQDLFGKYGKISRIGGDEFCGIVAGLTESEFEDIKKEMSERVNTLQIYGSEIKMEIASGYCAFDKKTDANLRETMKRADEKMYENKIKLKNGQNIR